MFNKVIVLNRQYKPHLIVGVLLAIWLYGFLVLVGPFDGSDVSQGIRVTLMSGYGFIYFLCYAILIPIQNKIYQIKGRWTIGFEIAVVCFFCLYALPICFAYYKTDIVNGTANFLDYSLKIYAPIIAILIPIIFIGRRFTVLNQKSDQPTSLARERTVILTGDNKRDVLRLAIENIIALEAANNYVVVHYLQHGNLQKKLLRGSLSKTHKAVPELIQVHRSYVINPIHFIEWKDKLTLIVAQLTVPVSKKYRPTLLETFTTK